MHRERHSVPIPQDRALVHEVEAREFAMMTTIRNHGNRSFDYKRRATSGRHELNMI